MFKLIRPSAAYQESYLDAVTEFQAAGEMAELDVVEIRERFEAYVAELCDRAHQASEERVPCTITWMVQGERYIGTVEVRHALNDELSLYGGHIGGEVRPTERRKGYATQALTLALGQAREVGLKRVLITCDADNRASRRVIEANGGQCEREFMYEGTLICHYHIDL